MTRAKSSPHRTLQLAAGEGAGDLEASIRQALADGRWEPQARLPTTRELGLSFGVSNATVSRLLNRLARDGALWRRPNGRYYSAASARLFAEPRTYACLLRKLEHWSRVYFGVMSGFSRDFVQHQEAMLLFHNPRLVRHTDTGHAPIHAGAASQSRALEEFLAVPRPRLAGVVLDDVWHDDVIEPVLGRLQPAVVVCRPTRLTGLSSVTVDFAAAVHLALGHLFARGYEKIILAVPFSGASPIDLMVAAAKQCAAHLGHPFAPDDICLVSTEEKRRRLLARVAAMKGRVGIFCPEDNVALQLYHDCVAGGLSLPDRVGLVAGMGTDVVAPHGLSTLRIDYEAIGQTAARVLRDRIVQNVVIPAQLRIGKTS
jgi:hypothetical protein